MTMLRGRVSSPCGCCEGRSRDFSARALLRLLPVVASGAHVPVSANAIGARGLVYALLSPPGSVRKVPGPPPKPAELRRRRNQTPAVVKLPAEGSRRKPPKLPNERRLHPATHAWRATWETRS
jgi:hypothetical protein